METTSRAGYPGRAGAARAPGAPGADTAPRDPGLYGAPALDGYQTAGFPWYGLDEAFTGPRWLMQVGAAADGIVEHGSTGHGEAPSAWVESRPENRRFVVVVTVASRPVRRSADGTGVLEATSVSTAAWLAGAGLLSCTWPIQMEHGLRQDWLDQQTATAWDLADELGGPGWSSLSLPVDGVPAPFHYRESEYGWVMASTTPYVGGDSGSGQLHLGAYGRGISAYGLGFSMIKDIASYVP